MIVNVNVGDGEGVNVAVGVKVGEGVTVSLGEGNGVIVQVEVNVAVAVGNNGEAKARPPHARMIGSAVARRRTLYRMIDVPQNPQAIECKPRRNDLNRVGFLCNDFCKPACRDHLHRRSEFLAKALHHALDHAHITE